MIWLGIILLLLTVFVFLWHPQFGKAFPKILRLQIIGTTLFMASLIYYYKGAPLLRDFPLRIIKQPESTTAQTTREMLKKNPEHVASWITLGRLYEREKQYYESALHFREAWRLTPQDRELKALFTKALLLLHKGKVTPTIKKLLQELEEEAEKF